MQPKLHISEAVSQCFQTSEISGALYHLEPTWLEKARGFSFLAFLLSVSFFAIALLVMNSSYSVSFSLFIEFLILLVLPDPLPLALSGMLLASPKSHILISQSSETRIFAGFTSRCKTLHDYKNLKAQSMLYIKMIVWFYSRSTISTEFISFFKSVSTKSITMNMPKSFVTFSCVPNKFKILVVN